MDRTSRVSLQDQQQQSSRVEETLQRVRQFVAGQQYEKAIDLLKAAGYHPRLRNAKGVCLMRAGRIEEAVRAFRDLVLQPGCTWARPELPTEYKTNFATALLLDGHPSGCVEILGEIKDPQHPSVVRLREAIRRWELQLNWWHRFNWRIGSIDPHNCPVKLDFPPGDIDAISDHAPRPAEPPRAA